MSESSALRGLQITYLNSQTLELSLASGKVIQIESSEYGMATLWAALRAQHNATAPAQQVKPGLTGYQHTALTLAPHSPMDWTRECECGARTQEIRCPRCEASLFGRGKVPVGSPRHFTEKGKVVVSLEELDL